MPAMFRKLRTRVRRGRPAVTYFECRLTGRVFTVRGAS